MTITTLAQANDGIRLENQFSKSSGLNQAGLFTTWGQAPAGAYDTTLNGVTLTSPVTGQIPFEDIAGGLEAYLYRMTASAAIPQMVYLCDRLWHNGGINITSTSFQSITSPTFPARDRNGATNGEDVFIDLEVSATTGAGTPVPTLSYINSAGVGSRTATAIEVTVASSLAGRTYSFGVQSGDRGVRGVQGIQLSSSWTSGTINLVARRQLASLPVRQSSVAALADVLTGLMVKMHPNSVPYIMFRATTAQGTGLPLVSTIQVTHG
jgi:hypothetical protein